MIVEKDKSGLICQISFPILSILKIQDAAIKDPSLRILPKYNAQGNKHQWILPTNANETWRQLSLADLDLRDQIRNKISEAKNVFSSLQKGADPKQIDAIFSTPDNNQFIYYKTDFDGKLLEVAITGWGFRYPENSQKDGIIMSEMGRNDQIVKINIVDDGEPAVGREFEYGLRSNSKTKMGITDKDGKFVIGNCVVGLEFFVRDKQTCQLFSFIVVKGQEIYICDVTVKSEETEVPEEPEVKEEDIETAVDEKIDDEEETKEEEPYVEEEPDENEEEEEPKIVPPIGINKMVSPKLQVVDENGSPVSNFPVNIEYDGTKTRTFSGDVGYVQMQEMTEDDVFSVTDGFSDNNRQNYIVAADKDVYIYHLGYTLTSGNKDISILIIDEKGRPVCNDYIMLLQEGRSMQCTPSDKGLIYLDNDDFLRNKRINFILVQDGKEISTDDFMLIPNEQEYTVQIDTRPFPFWKGLLEVLGVMVGAISVLYIFSLIVSICSLIA